MRFERSDERSFQRWPRIISGRVGVELNGKVKGPILSATAWDKWQDAPHLALSVEQASLKGLLQPATA